MRVLLHVDFVWSSFASHTKIVDICQIGVRFLKLGGFLNWGGGPVVVVVLKVTAAVEVVEVVTVVIIL